MYSYADGGQAIRRRPAPGTEMSEAYARREPWPDDPFYPPELMEDPYLGRGPSRGKDPYSGYEWAVGEGAPTKGEVAAQVFEDNFEGGRTDYERWRDPEDPSLEEMPSRLRAEDPSAITALRKAHDRAANDRRGLPSSRVPEQPKPRAYDLVPDSERRDEDIRPGRPTDDIFRRPFADGGFVMDPMMDPMADPLMDGLPMDPMDPMDPMTAQAPAGGDDPETLAAAAFEVATEYLPAVPTPVLEQTLMAFAAEFEQRMAGGAMQPQAPMAAAPAPQGIGSLV